MAVPSVAFLRGINVGGKNKLPMTDLREMFVAAGCCEVRTYIQSGNVIFQADPDVLASLPSAVSALIAERTGYRVPVVVRSTEQLATVIHNNPFLTVGAAEETLHVLFLADRPSVASIATLDPDRCPPDAFVVQGQEIYLHLPNGMARTKLTNEYFDSRLSTVSTARNWRTVTTLLDLMTA